jgi:hypothetical protein
VTPVLPEQLPDDVSQAAVPSRHLLRIELAGRAGLQCADSRVVLRPVRVEVEDLSQLSGGEASVVHVCRRSLA